uniref:RING-type domain-containing protein n=1 Tax=Globodera rostochiensis TaxID=31243 RepID=A0A914H4T2_GLORO
MESIKISTALAYIVKETCGNGTFVGWKAKGCEVLWDREMLRLQLEGTAKERSELRQAIFNALKKAQLKMEESGKKSQQMVIMEVEIPSNCCGLVIGADGETIRKTKADSGVHSLYIDPTGRHKVNRQPRPNFSWLVICSYAVGPLMTAWARVEELLSFTGKLDPGHREKQATQKLCIPAAEFFSREQTRRFEQIKRTAQGVQIDLDSSDPGEQFRSVTLSGTQNNISSVKMELNMLIDEVKTSMPTDREKHSAYNDSSGEELPSPPELPNGFSDVKSRKEAIGFGKKKTNGGAPSDPVQPRRVEKCKKEVLVPKKCIVHVIGNGGENIRQLQEKFGVKMHFLGNNYLEYPNGRTLSITGDSEEKVESARDYVDKEFILKKWEAWNTYQHDIISAEETCEEICHLSPKFALREDLEFAMKKMKDQSGIVSYCYRQFRSGHRPIVLRGTEMAVEKATKILTKMEEEWSRQQQSTLGNSRARSLDDISITSLNVTNELDELPNDKNGREKAKEERVQVKKSVSAVRETAIDGRDCGGGDFTDDNETLYGSASGEESADDRRRMVSFARNNESASSTIGSNRSMQRQHQHQKLNGVQQILLDSAKGALDKMNKIMESKDAQIRHLEDSVSRILCTECTKSERSVLFTPCRHFLCCQKCAEPLKHCPICKGPSKKRHSSPICSRFGLGGEGYTFWSSLPPCPSPHVHLPSRAQSHRSVSTLLIIPTNGEAMDPSMEEIGGLEFEMNDTQLFRMLREEKR